MFDTNFPSLATLSVTKKRNILQSSETLLNNQKRLCEIYSSLISLAQRKQSENEILAVIIHLSLNIMAETVPITHEK